MRHLIFVILIGPVMSGNISKSIAKEKYQSAGCCPLLPNHKPCAIVTIGEMEFTCAEINEMYCGATTDYITYDDCELCYGVHTDGVCAPSPPPEIPAPPPPLPPPPPESPPPTTSPSPATISCDNDPDGQLSDYGGCSGLSAVPCTTDLSTLSSEAPTGLLFWTLCPLLCKENSKCP